MTRTAAEKAAIARDGEWCLRCGRNLCEVAAAVHHRLPRSGGTKAQVDRVENCVTVCDGCHRHIHAQPRESYASGWLVRRGADPAGQYLLDRHNQMLMLLPDGGLVVDSLPVLADFPPPF